MAAVMREGENTKTNSWIAFQLEDNTNEPLQLLTERPSSDSICRRRIRNFRPDFSTNAALQSKKKKCRYTPAA